MKRMIRFSESDIERIVKLSVNKMLREPKGLDPSKRDSEFASLFLTFLLAVKGLRVKIFSAGRKFSILARLAESAVFQQGMFFNSILKKVNRQFESSKLTVYSIVKRRFALRKASISVTKTVDLLR